MGRRLEPELHSAGPIGPSAGPRGTLATIILEIQPPEVLHRLVKFDSQLPSRGALVPTPDQVRVVGIPVDQVDHPNLLPDRESVWRYREAASCADVFRIPLCPDHLPLLGRLDGHGHAGIKPSYTANFLSSRLNFHMFLQWHFRELLAEGFDRSSSGFLLGSQLRRKPCGETPNVDAAGSGRHMQRLRARLPRVNGTSLPVHPQS